MVISQAHGRDPLSLSSWQVRLLRLAVILAGFNVMALEMCGFRVVTTEYGSSVYTTGSLLTLIMVALSLGYFFGGRRSLAGNTWRPLLMSWGGAGAYIFLINVILAPQLLSWGFSLRTSLESHPWAMHVAPPVLIVSVLYGPPMVLLAMTTPLALRLCATELRDSVGQEAGNLMALSTFGSIVGTLLTSYVLLPGFGTRRTLLALCASMAVGVMLMSLRRGRANFGAVVAGLVALLSVAQAGASVPMEPRPGSIFSAETRYGRIDVYRRIDDDGEQFLVYKPSRIYEHSVVYPEHPLKDQLGVSYFTPAIAWGAKRVLVLGGAAGGSIRQLLAADPNVDITSVEIDPDVTAMSEVLFGVRRSAQVHLVEMDARVFLRESKSRYDYIIVDLFSGDQLPAHCATSEFFSLARAVLNPGGIMFVNSNMRDFPWSDDATAPRPLWHLEAAIGAAGFPSIFQNDLFGQGHLYAFTEPTAIEGFRAHLLAVARSPHWPVELRAEAAADALATVPAPPRRAVPFTDDWSPEELLQLKGNLAALTLDLARTPPAAPDSNSPLRDIIGRELLPTRTENGQLGADSERYCRAVLEWAGAASRSTLDPLARMHLFDVDCSASAKYFPNPNSRAAAAYTHAMKLVLDNRGQYSLPLLLSVADEFAVK